MQRKRTFYPAEILEHDKDRESDRHESLRCVVRFSLMHYNPTVEKPMK